MEFEKVLFLLREDSLFQLGVKLLNKIDDWNDDEIKMLFENILYDITNKAKKVYMYFDELDEVISKIMKGRVIDISIEELRFFYVDIVKLPKFIFYLNNLKCLQVVNCPVKELPIELFNVKSLIDLCFTSTNLQVISKQISNLTNLEYLNFSKNKIKTLPKEIGDLKNLKIIMIGDNTNVINADVIYNFGVSKKCIIYI